MEYHQRTLEVVAMIISSNGWGTGDIRYPQEKRNKAIQTQKTPQN